MDIRSLQRPLKERYRGDPEDLAHYPAGHGQPDRRPGGVLGGYRPRHLSGRSSRWSWRCRHWGLFRRSPAGRARGLRPDHLPNGRRRHGNCGRAYSRHRRRGPGPGRHAGHFQDSAGGVRTHPAPIRCCRAASHRRTIERLAREDRAVLRGHADLAPSPEDRSRMGSVRVVWRGILGGPEILTSGNVSC